MPSLPTPGGDSDTWGDELNEFLRVAHNEDGTDKHLELSDLGLLHVTDLLAGPATLATPDAGSLVQAFASPAGFVTIDSMAMGVYVTYSSYITASGATPILLGFSSTGSYAGTVSVQNPQLYAIADGTALKAVLVTYTGIPITATPANWQASHVYAAYGLILRSGVYWSADSGGGTSGGSAPDFASAPNPGDTVTDNTVVWTNEGTVPTAGSLQLYLLTISP